MYSTVVVSLYMSWLEIFAYIKKYITNLWITLQIAFFERKRVSEWVIVALRQLTTFSAMSWREQVNFQWDDDEVRLVLDQQT
jgi:hypothetical protein